MRIVAFIPAFTANHGYEAGHSSHTSLTASSPGGATVATTRGFDNLGRLSSISTGVAPVLGSHAYGYDGSNRRVRADKEDGAWWSYGYNDRKRK